MADLDNTLRLLEGGKEKDSRAALEQTLQDLEYESKVTDRNIRRSRSMRSSAGLPAPTNLPAFTSDEEDEAAQLQAALGDQPFDKTSLTTDPGPEFFTTMFDIARSSTEGNVEAKFKERFPNAEMLRARRGDNDVRFLYRMAPDQPFKVIPKITAATLASHLGREDTAASIAGGVFGTVAGGAVAGPVGGVAGSVGGAMAGDAVGQLLRQAVEEARGFGEGYKIDPMQVALAGGGQAVGEAVRLGPAYLKNKAIGAAQRAVEGTADLTERVTAAASDLGLGPVAAAQISKNPVFRTMFNQLVQLTKTGEQYVVGQSQRARGALTSQMDEDALATLGGPEFADTVGAARQAGQPGSDIPAVYQSSGGAAISKGLESGLAKRAIVHQSLLEKASVQMRGEKAPFFDISQLQRIAEEILTPIRARGAADEAGGRSDVALDTTTAGLRVLAGKILDMDPVVRTYFSRQAGEMTTGVQAMEALRDMAFALRKDPRGAALLDGVRASMDSLQGVTEKTPGYLNYLRGTKKYKEYEDLADQVITQNPIGRAERGAETGGQALAAFRPGNLDTWRTWKKIMPAEEFETVQQSIKSELARAEDPEASLAKLNSFNNDQGTLRAVMTKSDELALRELLEKKIAFKNTGLEDRVAKKMTAYDNGVNLAFDADPATLEIFLSKATPSQKEGLRTALYKKILTDTTATEKQGGSLINANALNDIVTNIEANPDRFLQFLTADDIKRLHQLREFVGGTQRQSDVGSSFTRGAIVADLVLRPFGWLTSPVEHFAKAGMLISAESMAKILTSPALSSGMSTVAKRLADSAGSLPDKATVNLWGAITGKALHELDKMGEFTEQ